MKRLTTHSGAEHFTGDELANAVCHYSLVLARIGVIDTIDIPTVQPDGHVASTRLTVGWEAGVGAVGVPNVGEGPDDILTVIELYARAADAVPHGEAFTDDEIQRLQWPDP